MSNVGVSNCHNKLDQVENNTAQSNKRPSTGSGAGVLSSLQSPVRQTALSSPLALTRLVGNAAGGLSPAALVQHSGHHLTVQQAAAAAVGSQASPLTPSTITIPSQSSCTSSSTISCNTPAALQSHQSVGASLVQMSGALPASVLNTAQHHHQLDQHHHQRLLQQPADIVFGMFFLPPFYSPIRLSFPPITFFKAYFRFCFASPELTSKTFLPTLLFSFFSL